MFLRFLLPWTFIACVVGIDIHLTIRHSFIMEQVEINPLGRLVLREPEGVALLASMKAVGLGAALLFIFTIWQNPRYKRAATLSSYAVACLHAALLVVFCNDGLRADHDAIHKQLLIENQNTMAHQKPIMKDKAHSARSAIAAEVDASAVSKPTVTFQSPTVPSNKTIPPKHSVNVPVKTLRHSNIETF